MKKITIIVISLLCCAFLLSSCQDEGDSQPPPENGNEEEDKDKNAPGSKPEDPAKPDDKIKTVQPSEKGKDDTPESPGVVEKNDELDAEEEVSPVTDDEGYYTILNDSDDSSLLISVFSNLNNIVLEESNCVKITEAQFQDDIYEIVHIFDEEDNLFCSQSCGSDCETCTAGNYRVVDAFWWASDDYIESSEGPSTDDTCVPLLEFANSQ